jgi:hypothetical protein
MPSTKVASTDAAAMAPTKGALAIFQKRFWHLRQRYALKNVARNAPSAGRRRERRTLSLLQAGHFIESSSSGG